MLLSRYGCCSIGGEAVQLRDPFPSAGSFTECSVLERRSLQGSIAELDRYPRWAVWPDAGGFLPWADLRDGSGEIGWLTRGAPDEWPVAVLERGGRGTETSFTTLDYLLHLARHIGDDEFEREGIGWMDDRTSIPYRHTPGSLPAREPLEVSFAAFPYEPADEVWHRSTSASDLRARAKRLRAHFEPMRSAWDQRWSAAEPVIVRAATDGIRISSASLRGNEPGWIQPFISFSFPVGEETRAKEVLVELASALATTVFEVRDLERRRIWTDVTGGSTPPEGLDP